MGAVAAKLRDRAAAQQAARLTKLRAVPAKAFPPPPVVPLPSSEISSAAASEIQAGRGIADAFEKMSITSTPLAQRGGADAPGASASAAEEGAPPGVPFRDLWEALVLHAQDPQKWPAEALAKKLSYTGEPSALADTLHHVAAFQTVEDRSGRMRGVPYDPGGERDVSSDPAALGATMEEGSLRSLVEKQAAMEGLPYTARRKDPLDLTS